MGHRADLGELRLGDFFLRRVPGKRYIAGGIVDAGVFRDRHPTLSFTRQDESLRLQEGLDQYQKEKALPSGDLPGIVGLSYEDLTVAVQPPLIPWLDPDPEDSMYGCLHCSTEQPSELQRDQMAERATEHGVLRQFIRSTG